MNTLPKSIGRLKQEASALSKTNTIPHTTALDEIAKQYGFANWKAILKADQNARALKQPVPAISNNFIEDAELVLLADDLATKERDADLDPETKIKLAKIKLILHP